MLGSLKAYGDYKKMLGFEYLGVESLTEVRQLL